MVNHSKNIDELENIINYSFNDKSLLIEALTHNSYANENNIKYNYERLEFLGDSVLQLILSEYIITTFKDFNEGEMSQLRAFLVNEEFLSYTAKEFFLHDFIKLGKGELAMNGNLNTSIIADIFEALIAAIYLDGSFDSARNFVIRLFRQAIHVAVKDRLFIDEKGELQRLSQKYFKVLPIYSVVDTQGSDHDKIFTVMVSIADKIEATSTGKNKKTAEKSVALIAINKLKSFLKVNE